VIGNRIEIVAMRRDGREFPVELTIVRAPLDGPPLFTGFIRDISERKRRQAFDRFMAEAGALLGASLELEDTLASVTRLAVPGIADWCAIDLLTDEGSFRRVAAAHTDPAKTELAYDLARRWPGSVDDPVGFGAVVRTGEPEFYEELPQSAIEHLEPERRRIVESLGLRSLVIVPLRSPNGRMLGGLALVTAESGRTFDERDVGIALELGRRCGVAIDNARLYEERSRIAHTLQRSLLPPDLPEVPGVELEARFRPAGEGIEMGGDFYDVFALADGRWAMVLADVCGKGPDAAALTALVRYTVRAVTMHERAPARVLTLLNEAILRHRGDDRFCSAVFATLETRPEGAVVDIASGGHPLPLLLRGTGGVETAGGTGLLLGLWPDPKVESEAVELGPGDALVFYTDGVTDARAPERILGADDLARLLGSCAGSGAAATADAIETAVTDTSTEPRDDLALLVVAVGAAQRAGGAGGGGLRVTLERRPEAASEARRAIATLEGRLRSAVVDELKLLATELVTNGCRHAVGDEHLAMEVGIDGETVRVAVIDSGPGFEPQVTHGNPMDESGRGLVIVDALADRWGVETGDRTRVWAEVDLDPSPSRNGA
ncbi:MAG TPA: SpoIIE family protein phosphatase, partial [Thermoleophilaceae bacterium]